MESYENMAIFVPKFTHFLHAQVTFIVNKHVAYRARVCVCVHAHATHASRPLAINNEADLLLPPPNINCL